MWPVALIPVTDRMPLVKSMKASVRRNKTYCSPTGSAAVWSSQTQNLRFSPLFIVSRETLADRVLKLWTQRVEPTAS